MLLMVPWCVPGPISWLDGSGDVVPLVIPVCCAFPFVLVGEEEVEVLRERSKMRSFFSAPPVARMCGAQCEGKATARTM